MTESELERYYQQLISREFRSLQLDPDLRAMSLFDLIDYCVLLYGLSMVGEDTATVKITNYVRGYLIMNYFINSFIMLHYKGFDTFIEQSEKDFIIYLNLFEFYNLDTIVSDNLRTIPLKHLRKLMLTYLVKRQLLSFDVEELYNWLYQYIDYLREVDKERSGQTNIDNSIQNEYIDTAEKTHRARGTKSLKSRLYANGHITNSHEVLSADEFKFAANSLVDGLSNHFGNMGVSSSRSSRSSTPPTPPRHGNNEIRHERLQPQESYKRSVERAENEHVESDYGYLERSHGYHRVESAPPPSGSLHLPTSSLDNIDFEKKYPEVHHLTRKAPTEPIPMGGGSAPTSSIPSIPVNRSDIPRKRKDEVPYPTSTRPPVPLQLPPQIADSHTKKPRPKSSYYPQIATQSYSTKSGSSVSLEMSNGYNRPPAQINGDYYGESNGNYPPKSYPPQEIYPIPNTVPNGTYGIAPVYTTPGGYGPTPYAGSYMVPYNAPPPNGYAAPQPHPGFIPPHVREQQNQIKTQKMHLQKEYCICGLKNFGSSCYLNLTVQMIFGLSQFKTIFENLEYHTYLKDPRFVRMLRQLKSQHGNRDTLLLSEAILGLLRTFRLFGGSSIAPTKFIRVTSLLKPELNIPVEQQDAQEFLLFVLDRLHEELSNKTAIDSGAVDPAQYLNRLEVQTPEPPYVEWYKSLLRYEGSLPISDLFQGHLQNKLICTHCNFESTTYSLFTILSLPIPTQGTTTVDLSDCIRHYTQDEILTGDNAWNCPKCAKSDSGTVTSSLDTHPVFTPRKSGIFRLGKRSKSPAKRTTPHPHHRNPISIKKLEFTKLPKVLFVHLSRFLTNSMTEKLNVNIQYPLELQIKNVVYKLLGLINHYGNLKSGHYTALVDKAPPGLRLYWCVFDDELVRANVAHGSHTQPYLVSKDVYVLSYERVLEIQE